MKESFTRTVLPAVYQFVKRHKRFRAWALFLWNGSFRLKARLRRILAGRQSIPPPRASLLTAQWIAQAPPSSPGGPKAALIPVFPQESIHRPAPKCVEEEVHWKFQKYLRREIPGAFVATIPCGRSWGPGFIVTPDNVLLQDVSRAITLDEDERNPPRHPLLAETKLEKPEKLRGRAAVLATRGGRGYYHWMFDSLPRAAILRQAGIEFETVDWFVVNECVAPFQRLALKALGIPKRKLVQVNWHPHIQAEELIVPSHAGELSFMPRWACDFLRELLHPHPAANSGPSRPARLYIKRQQATHRRVANEREVGAFLEDLGFASIDPAALPLPEQAALFSSASIVVAPHGAGLANLVFCRPGVKVIEIFNPNAVNVMFWCLSAQMELDYFYVFARGVPALDGVDMEPNREDLLVDLQKLRDTLRLAGICQP
jgi:hypothetical protein